MTQLFEHPAGKLVLSTRYQARKKPGQMPLADLATSIHLMGLLQNLIVTKSKKRGVYEVVGGGRRLQAIFILLADGRWPADKTIWLRLVENDTALEASIVENTQREQMHPADEFEAFAKLVEQGKSVEDIAASFGVTPTVVKRRLRLASVAPELIQAYRDEETTLEAIMAFTVTEDQDRQRELWAGLDQWDRQQAHIIRRRLSQGAVTAAHSVARFVGLDAYHAAGGRTFEDLFAQEDGAGTYLQDVDLLDNLAMEKLQLAAATVKEEGWSWVEAELTYNQSWRNFGHAQHQVRKLTKAEAAQVKSLTKLIDTVSEQMDALADSEEGEDEWLKLDEQHDTLLAEREAISGNAQTWPQASMALSGAVLCLDPQGCIKVERGLIHPKDRKQVVAANEQASAAGEAVITSSLPAPATRPTHSERLVRQLTANKVAIVGADLASKPDIALAILVAQLARKVLGSGYFSCGDYGLGVSLKPQEVSHYAPDFPESKAGREFAQQRQYWLDILPLDEHGDLSEGVLDWARAQDTATLLELLAYLVATSVQGVQHQEPSSPTELDALATVTGVDIAQWWEPTAESYLAHVSKDQIAVALAEGAGPEAAFATTKLKKGEAVEYAQTALAGKRWLPTPLRVATLTDNP